MDPIDIATETLAKAQGTSDTEALAVIIAALAARRWRPLLEDLVQSAEREAKVMAASGVLGKESESSRRARLLLSLLGALLLELRSGAVGTLSSSDREVVRAASMRLLLQGAKGAGVALDVSSARAVEAAAAAERDLGLLVAGRIAAREADIRTLLTRVLAPDTTAGGPLDSAEALRTALRELVGVATETWVPQAVDAWAFRWRNVGAILGARQSGLIELLVVNNPPKGPDTRTTAFCRHMHGTRISVAQVERQVERYILAVMQGQADAGKTIWPLRGSDMVGDKAAGSFPFLAAGIGPPPWHWFCRTILTAP